MTSATAASQNPTASSESTHDSDFESSCSPPESSYSPPESSYSPPDPFCSLPEPSCLPPNTGSSSVSSNSTSDSDIASSCLPRDSSSVAVSTGCSSESSVIGSSLLADDSSSCCELTHDSSTFDVESDPRLQDSFSTDVEFALTDNESILLPHHCSSADIESSLSSDNSDRPAFSPDCSSVILPLNSSPGLTLVSLTTLVSNICLPSQHWCLRNKEDGDDVIIYKVSDQASSSAVPLKITHSITIKSDLTWELSVHGYLVNKKRCHLLSGFPDHLTQASLCSLLSLVDGCKVCPGHPDLKFVQMAQERKGVILSKNKTVAAQVDDYSPVFLQGESFMSTVRVHTCELLVVSGVRCAVCKSYRSCLLSIYRGGQSRNHCLLHTGNLLQVRLTLGGSILQRKQSGTQS